MKMDKYDIRLLLNRVVRKLPAGSDYKYSFDSVKDYLVIKLIVMDKEMDIHISRDSYDTKSFEELADGIMRRVEMEFA
jgi:hypothetical protein